MYGCGGCVCAVCIDKWLSRGGLVTGACFERILDVLAEDELFRLLPGESLATEMAEGSGL